MSKIICHAIHNNTPEGKHLCEPEIFESASKALKVLKLCIRNYTVSRQWGGHHALAIYQLPDALCSDGNHLVSEEMFI